MRILAIERDPPLPIHQNLHDLLRDEAAAVWALQKCGVIREIWLTATDRHTVAMLECANAADARKTLAELPLVRAGLIDFTVHELTTYDGFERLFAAGREPAGPVPEEPPEY